MNLLRIRTSIVLSMSLLVSMYCCGQNNYNSTAPVKNSGQENTSAAQMDIEKAAGDNTILEKGEVGSSTPSRKLRGGMDPDQQTNTIQNIIDHQEDINASQVK